MKLTRNRTIIAIVCVILAAALCFGVAPAVTNLFNRAETVLVLNTDVGKGVAITDAMFDRVELTKRDTLGLNYISDSSTVVGKYAKTYLYKGLATSDMFTDTLDDIDYKLSALSDGQLAMSVTVQSLAGGFSGKLAEGDVIKIISMDEENQPIVYDELNAVEVLAATNDDGNNVSGNNSEDGEANLPTTIIVKLVDEAQALRLLSCESSTLHAVFVARDKDMAEKYLNSQAVALGVISDVTTSTENTTIPETSDITTTAEATTPVADVTVA